MISPRNSDNKPKTSVTSTSGGLSGTLHWSGSEKTWLLLFRDPNDGSGRRRLKKRVADADEARRELDVVEGRWAARQRAMRGPDSDPNRPRFLTPEQQEDALRALDLLGGRVSITQAVTALLALPGLKEAAAQPDGGRAFRRALDRAGGSGFSLSPWADEPGSLSGDTTVWDLVEAFLRHKRRDGKTAATLLTYEARLRPILDAGSRFTPASIGLTRTRVAKECLGLSERSAYGFLTAISSLEDFYFEVRGFTYSHTIFSVRPIREAAAFFHHGGLILQTNFDVRDHSGQPGRHWDDWTDKEVAAALEDDRFVKVARDWWEAHPEDRMWHGARADVPATRRRRGEASPAPGGKPAGSR